MRLAVDGRLQAALAVEPLWVAPVILLVGAGLVLIGVALGMFDRLKTRPEPWKPASALVTSGIYGRTRNPMYLGRLLFYAGLALLFRSPSAGFLLIPLLLIIDWLIILREEHYLSRHFGAAYDEYRRTVRL